MAFQAIFLVVTVIGSVISAPVDDSKKYEEFHVVPDIISAAPPAKINVMYGDLNVDLGNELTPTQVHDKPTIKYDAEEGAFYTLIMVDRDIPPQVGAKEVQHWVVVNIPGNDITKGETLFDYLGAGPPEGSGLHRYVILLYKQNDRLEEKLYANLKDNKGGSMKSRTAQELPSLTEMLKLGQPVAGNFYRAQYDKNVPMYADEAAKKFA